MTHDRLCPSGKNPFIERDACRNCSMIDEVRADERNGCIAELENYYCPDEDTDYWTGFEDGIRKSIDLLDLGRTYD